MVDKWWSWSCPGTYVTLVRPGIHGVIQDDGRFVSFSSHSPLSHYHPMSTASASPSTSTEETNDQDHGHTAGLAPRRVDHTYRNFSHLTTAGLPRKKSASNFPSKLHKILSTEEFAHVSLCYPPHAACRRKCMLDTLFEATVVCRVCACLSCLLLMPVSNNTSFAAITDHLLDGKHMRSSPLPSPTRSSTHTVPSFV